MNSFPYTKTLNEFIILSILYDLAKIISCLFIKYLFPFKKYMKKAKTKNVMRQKNALNVVDIEN